MTRRSPQQRPSSTPSRRAAACGLLALSLALSGCAHVIVATSGDEPMDSNHGERTLGYVIEDESIELKSEVNLLKAREAFADAQFEVTSYNGLVLITGQVPSLELKRRAALIIRRIRHVRRVHNRLQVGPNLGLWRLLKDDWLEASVATRMLLSAGFPSGRVEVIVHGGVIYLMGLVSQEQARRAVSICQQARGVRKIVKVMEYVPDGSAGTAE